MVRYSYDIRYNNILDYLFRALPCKRLGSGVSKDISNVTKYLYFK